MEVCPGCGMGRGDLERRGRDGMRLMKEVFRGPGSGQVLARWLHGGFADIEIWTMAGMQIPAVRDVYLVSTQAAPGPTSARTSVLCGLACWLRCSAVFGWSKVDGKSQSWALGSGPDEWVVGGGGTETGRPGMAWIDGGAALPSAGPK